MRWNLLCLAGLASFLAVGGGASAQSDSYKVYEPGKAPALRGFTKKPSEMVKTAHSPANGLPYEFRMDLMVSKEGLNTEKSSSTWGYASKEEAGEVGYKPRITIMAINRDVPENAKMVVEYFAKNISDLRKVAVGVEHIPLPAILRGQSRIVDAGGLQLYRYKFQNNDGYSDKAGKDFCGVIVSLFDGEGKLWLQCMSDRQLAPMSGPDLQESKEYNDNTPRRHTVVSH